LLYFIEKQSPSLDPWQRELVRIVRKFAEYFHPQRLTKVLNEGFASFTHYTLLHAMHDAQELSDANFLEAIESHTAVVKQRAFGEINPYALGFSIFRDLRRVCEQPQPEDFHLLPAIAGQPFRTMLREAVTTLSLVVNPLSTIAERIPLPGRRRFTPRMVDADVDDVDD
jgi:stage V sporulation protein R